MWSNGLVKMVIDEIYFISQLSKHCFVEYIQKQKNNGFTYKFSGEI